MAGEVFTAQVVKIDLSYKVQYNSPQMREFLLPSEEEILSATSSEHPLAVLTTMLDGVPKKLPFALAKEMREQGRIGELLVLCLPTMIVSISPLLCYGVPEDEILATGLASTFEVIKEWNPVVTEGNQASKFLKFHVYNKTRKSAQLLVVKEYGLDVRDDFPVVESFRTCLENHLDKTGQRPTMAEMVEAVEKALPGYRFSEKSTKNKEEPHKVEIIYRHIFRESLPVCVPPARVTHGQMDHQAEQAEVFRRVLELIASSFKDEHAMKTALQILIMKYADGMTNEAIGKRFGVSTSRIGQRIEDLRIRMDHPSRVRKLRLLRS